MNVAIQDPLRRKAAPSHTISSRRRVWGLAGTGFLLGVMLWVTLMQWSNGIVGITGFAFLPLLSGAVAALAGTTRARMLVWTAGAISVFGFAVIGYTPIVQRLVDGILVSDPPAHASAVVVLWGDGRSGGEIGEGTQTRLLHAYEILGQGYAPRLVMTHAGIGGASPDIYVRRQMRLFGMSYPIDVVGPISDTHDEAVAVANLAHERGWARVLVVTNPLHMRRALALFKKAGVTAVGSPCKEWRYDPNRLEGLDAKLTAFRAWAHEEIGYLVYKRRGWLD